jgi:hypothetical protein
MTFRYIRNGHAYDAGMSMAKMNDGKVGPTIVTLDSKTIYDLGATYVDTWHLGYGSDTDDTHDAIVESARPRVQLIYAYKDGSSEIVGEGRMPGIPWDKDVRGSYGEGYSGFLPMDIRLTNKNEDDQSGDVKYGDVIARGEAGLQVESMDKAAYWVRPSQALTFSEGSSQELHWAIDIPENTPIDFVFKAFKVTADDTYIPTSMVHTLHKKVCVRNVAFAKQYGIYGTPCVFSEILKVQAGLIGSRISFEVEYLKDGIKHRVLSAPVSFVNATTPATRRMQGQSVRPYSNHAEQTAFDDEEDETDDRNVPGRRLQVQPTNTDVNTLYNEKMGEMNPTCQREPLQYSIGVGLYFRAQVHNLQLPGFGAGISLPNWDSHLMPIESTEYGKKLSSVLPKTLCDGGMCDGTLPDCRAKQVDPTIIPKVEFKLSRDFDWSPTTTAWTRASIAYGMAMAPGLLELAAMSFKKLLQTTTTTTGTLTEADTWWPGTGDNEGKLCTWVPDDKCVNAFRYESNVHFGCTKSGSDTGWCSLDHIYSEKWLPCATKCKKEWIDMNQDDHGSSIFSPKKVAPTGSSSTQCFWDRDKACVPQFSYKGSSYYNCVTNEHDPSKAWCAHNQTFIMGQWSYCSWKCPVSFDNAPTTTTVTTTTTSTTVTTTTITTTTKTTTTTTTTTTLNTAWQCHHPDLTQKTDTEWDTWCKDNPVEGNKEYHWYGDSADGDSPCGGCWCCWRYKDTRRLEERGEGDEEDIDGPHETSSSFMVKFHPEAVIYKIDKKLIRELIHRGAFGDLRDGRERELGDAHIVGFSLHHSNGEIETEELDEEVQPIRDENHEQENRDLDTVPPTALVAGCVAALLVSLVTVRFARWQRRSVCEYAEVSDEAAPVE